MDFIKILTGHTQREQSLDFEFDNSLLKSDKSLKESNKTIEITTVATEQEKTELRETCEILTP